MKKAIAGILFVVFTAFSLAGCATASKKNEGQAQEMKDQISMLQDQLRTKDEEIASLRDELNRSSQEKLAALPAAIEQCARPSMKQIQTALKNAGFYTGTVDGKTGKMTREGIRAFQKANNLPADGMVGKKTWNLLKDYLEKKEK